jgi:hypothetical protein
MAKSNFPTRKTSKNTKKYLETLLTKKELLIVKSLNTPLKIQKFLDTLPINWEKEAETYMSPRRLLQNKTAHCIEGAMFASLCLWYHGQKPLLLDLKSFTGDDHVVALYKINNFWGAISKTNHVTLRFRDPVYKTVRELAISYYHEYFDTKNGKKILESFSEPFNLSKLKIDWITAEHELFEVAEKLDEIKHFPFVPKSQLKYLRKADKMELLAGKILEWEE